jgi:parallel beta-helix repeat protein
MNTLKSLLLVGCVILTSYSAGCLDGTTKNPSILYVDSLGTKQYTTIQQAIDDALDNSTIYVYAGTYYEHLVINKSVVLKGENKVNTIIDGNRTGDVIFVDEDGHVNISGFTIRNSGYVDTTTENNVGIEIHSDNNTIIDNLILNNNIGIYSIDAENNTYRENVYDGNKLYGMYLYTRSNTANTTENLFTNNKCALRIKGSHYIYVTNNIFINNTEGLYFCCGARYNTVYHNTFINNSLWNARDDVGNNSWDGGYAIGGNYWDDYNGTDEYQGIHQNITGIDGIGDIPYNISTVESKRDHYPLIAPVVNL